MKLAKPIKIVLILILVIVHCYFVFHSIKKITYPFEIDPVEGVMLNASRLLARGEALYYNNPTLNFHKITTLYPPVYYVLTGLWVKFYGTNFFGGRLISFLSNYLSAFLIFLILLKLTKDRFLSIMLSLMFPLLLPISCCGQYMRVDSLGLFLSLLALFLATAENRLLFYLSPVVLVLAFFTKFNFASLIVPVFFLILITKKAKWVFYLVEFALLSLVTFLWLNKTTEGAFFHNTFTYLGSASYSFPMALQFVLYIIVSYSFIALAIFNLLIGRKRLIGNDKEYLIFLCLLTEIPFLLFAMGKVGTTMNQFFQLSAFSLLTLGILLEKNKDNWENLRESPGSLLLFITPLVTGWIVSYYLLKETYPKLMLLIASAIYVLVMPVQLRLKKMTVHSCMAILIVAQIITIYFMPLGIQGENLAPNETLKRIELNREYFRKIIEILEKNPGPALTWLTGCLVLSGKDSVIEPFVLNNLYRVGLFSPERFYANISQKKYSVMVMPPRFRTLYESEEGARTEDDDSSIFTRRDFIMIVTDNYQITGKVGSAVILYPQEN